MEIILLETIDRLGGLGDLVNVRPGFARNYLLPQGKAKLATTANIAEIEARSARGERILAGGGNLNQADLLEYPGGDRNSPAMKCGGCSGQREQIDFFFFFTYEGSGPAFAGQKTPSDQQVDSLPNGRAADAIIGCQSVFGWYPGAGPVFSGTDPGQNNICQLMV